MNILESLTIEGDSPVNENKFNLSVILSNARHVKPCGKPGGPSSKAKYYLTTDSELVPWGKGEKYPCEGSEKVPEIVCLQAVEELYQFFGIGLLDRVPFASWVADLSFAALG